MCSFGILHQNYGENGKIHGKTVAKAVFFSGKKIYPWLWLRWQGWGHILADDSSALPAPARLAQRNPVIPGFMETSGLGYLHFTAGFVIIFIPKGSCPLICTTLGPHTCVSYILLIFWGLMGPGGIFGVLKTRGRLWKFNDCSFCFLSIVRNTRDILES